MREREREREREGGPMMGKLKHPKKHISQNRSVKNNKTNQPKIRTK